MLEIQVWKTLAEASMKSILEELLRATALSVCHHDEGVDEKTRVWNPKRPYSYVHLEI
jgi:hypothetical protein